MKKLHKNIVITLISIIVINALLSNVVLADDVKDPIRDYTNTDHSNILTGEAVNKYMNTGEMTGSSNVTRPTNTSTTTPISEEHDRDTNLQSEQSSYIATSLAAVLNLFGSVLQTFMSEIVGTTDYSKDMFTIQNLLMGKYELFDINIFNKNVDSPSASEISKQIKESVSLWYYSIRNLAIVISLIVLLYVAIRMAMSTLAAEKVRYKKMLLSWFVGFVLIFVIHYIALILITVSDQFVRILSSLAPIGETPFEYAVIEKIVKSKAEGWYTLVRAVLYIMLVWYQAKFFFIYLKRVVSNAFLILISPLVTVTYAIDKSNDCKAQAFNSWLEELITNIFIQPLHLLMFLVLLYSAGAIAEAYPIVAILFLFGLGKTEKVLRGLFRLKGTTIKGIDDGTTFTGLVSKI